MVMHTVNGKGPGIIAGPFWTKAMTSEIEGQTIYQSYIYGTLDARGELFPFIVCIVSDFDEEEMKNKTEIELKDLPMRF